MFVAVADAEADTEACASSALYAAADSACGGDGGGALGFGFDLDVCALGSHMASSTERSRPRRFLSRGAMLVTAVTAVAVVLLVLVLVPWVLVTTPSERGAHSGPRALTCEGGSARQGPAVTSVEVRGVGQLALVISGI